VWVPSATNAVVAIGVSAVVIGAVSTIFSAINNRLSASGSESGEKAKEALPDKAKEWFEDVVESRREVEASEKVGSVFMPTFAEDIAYFVAIVLLGISFAYVKVISVSQIWMLLPLFLVTSIIVGFTQKFFAIAYLRHKGVWSEHTIWPLGLVMFLFTTFVLRVPFSSPTRIIHSKKFTEKLGAKIAVFETLIGLAFAGLFFLLIELGYSSIGGAGLSMSIIGAFFSTFPIKPLGGKDIFNKKKGLWATIFIGTLAIFIAWLLLL
jgi:hypothetical protein